MGNVEPLETPALIVCLPETAPADFVPLHDFVLLASIKETPSNIALKHPPSHIAMALLQIPLELRQNIFRCVVCSPTEAPSSPSASQKGRYQLLESLSGDRGIWQLPPENPAISLLLVNKQVHIEVKDVLGHVPADYHVDIMFVKRYGLWTTWTIPRLPSTQYIDSVHATFRLFDPTDDLEPRFRNSLNFEGGAGGPEPALWAFYNLLIVLLCRGPGYFGPPRSSEPSRTNSQYVVKKIVVDILAPTDGATHRSLVWSDKECQGKPSRLHMYGRDLFDVEESAPEKCLASYIINHLHDLIDLTYHTMNYGMVLHESVAESIVVLVNGTECQRYDMEEIVQGHQVLYWGETADLIKDRKEHHRIWRIWLDERRLRMKHGLELDNNCPVDEIM
ncbi:hypothetical protein FZEAL_3720 [Fusarium zealandicum]|uniref:Uncharacterized protein n=1 Tax=Fusarium zealandicum TaxID=1053134 RepID=A0A8H4XLI3_9HYPO|nr:hypothetical protein FZEAL_3720 [Fusarium zealandicum]